jgi:hypothetical protein
MVLTPSLTWRQVYNPYARRPAAVGPEAPIALTTRPVVNDININMGIQSQNRDGSIKACKKRSIKRKAQPKAPPIYRQSAVPGGTIFINWQHCKVCKATRLNLMGKKVRVPHDPHHVRCYRNRTTRGASA